MHCTAKQVFSKMDNLLHQKLWRWAKRRHPNKSQKWIKTSISIDTITKTGLLVFGKIGKKNPYLDIYRG